MSFSTGGGSIGGSGVWIGQGNVDTNVSMVDIVAGTSFTITRLSATKDGAAAGTATLYINGLAVLLSAALPAGNIGNGTIVGNIAVSMFDRLSIKFKPDSNGWNFGAATLAIE